MKKLFFVNAFLILLLTATVSCKKEEAKSAAVSGGISIYAFDVAGVSSKEQSEQLNTIIGSMKGVNSCSVNPVSKIAAVVYNMDQISAEKIAGEVNQSTGYKLSLHKFKKVSGGCPIHKVSWWFSWLPWVD